jgi:nucleosome binding factor SPN SPT16 subunit
LRYHSTIRSDNRIGKLGQYIGKWLHKINRLKTYTTIIDILFSNVKHLFFQPCDNELIVLLHVHLKNPLLIGKKKIKV